MLDISLEGDILKVVEVTMTFFDTKRRYWYYNIKDWTTSSHGREGDVPDRKMDQSSIDWATKHYLPKVTGGGQ